MTAIEAQDLRFMRRALRLAAKGVGKTSPNPVVGAVLVKDGEVLGEGWHRKAGHAHAEIEAFRCAESRSKSAAGATLYVTLEPCSTHGRTPPCTDAILRSGVRRVVAATADPNPHHCGRGFELLRQAGIDVRSGVLADESNELNAPFNHWIVHRTPLVTLKSAMTLDGRIATSLRESKWITSDEARRSGRLLRKEADCIAVGVGTILADNPALTVRTGNGPTSCKCRIILDTKARTPMDSRVVCDEFSSQTLVVCGLSAPEERVAKLAERVSVLRVVENGGRVDVGALLKELGRRSMTNMLVEGGGEVIAAFISGQYAHRLVFYYAPIILSDKDAIRAVGGRGVAELIKAPRLTEVRYKRVGPDLKLTAKLIYPV